MGSVGGRHVNHASVDYLEPWLGYSVIYAGSPFHRSSDGAAGIRHAIYVDHGDEEILRLLVFVSHRLAQAPERDWAKLVEHLAHGILHRDGAEQREVIVERSFDGYNLPFAGGNFSDKEIQEEIIAAAHRLAVDARTREPGRVHVLDPEGLALELGIARNSITRAILVLEGVGEIELGRHGDLELVDGNIQPTGRSFASQYRGEAEPRQPLVISSVLADRLNEFEPSLPEPTKRCFVIMPFSDSPKGTEVEWLEVFTQILKPAVELADLGYHRYRSDSIGNIVKEIVVSIERDDVVLADVTDQKPNVFYELGVRHSIWRRGTIIAAQHTGDLPFDIINYRALPYTPGDADSLLEFAGNVKDAIRQIELNHELSDSPVYDFLGRAPELHDGVNPGPSGAALELSSYDTGQSFRLVISNSGNVGLDGVDFVVEPEAHPSWSFLRAEGENVGINLAPGEETEIIYTVGMGGGPLAVRVIAAGTTPDGERVEGTTRLNT